MELKNNSVQFLHKYSTYKSITCLLTDPYEYGPRATRVPSQAQGNMARGPQCTLTWPAGRVLYSTYVLWCGPRANSCSTA